MLLIGTVTHRKKIFSYYNVVNVIFLLLGMMILSLVVDSNSVFTKIIKIEIIIFIMLTVMYISIISCIIYYSKNDSSKIAKEIQEIILSKNHFYITNISLNNRSRWSMYSLEFEYEYDISENLIKLVLNKSRYNNARLVDEEVIRELKYYIDCRYHNKHKFEEYKNQNILAIEIKNFL